MAKGVRVATGKCKECGSKLSFYVNNKFGDKYIISGASVKDNVDTYIKSCNHHD